MKYRTPEEGGSRRTLMPMLPIKLAISFITILSLLSGCGNKASSQNSNLKPGGDKPSRTFPSDDEQILSGIRNIVAKQLSLDTSAIDVDAPLSKQKVTADELDVIEIIMKVEETFKIEIRDEEFSYPEGHLEDVSVRKLAHIVIGKKKGR